MSLFSKKKSIYDEGPGNIYEEGGKSPGTRRREQVEKYAYTAAKIRSKAYLGLFRGTSPLMHKRKKGSMQIKSKGRGGFPI